MTDTMDQATEAIDRAGTALIAQQLARNIEDVLAHIMAAPPQTNEELRAGYARQGELMIAEYLDRLRDQQKAIIDHTLPKAFIPVAFKVKYDKRIRRNYLEFTDSEGNVCVDGHIRGRRKAQIAGRYAIKNLVFFSFGVKPMHVVKEIYFTTVLTAESQAFEDLTKPIQVEDTENLLSGELGRY